MTKALITGITGQDGSYLAELLLEQGCEVHGIVRRVAIEDPEHRMWRIKHILPDIQLHSASLESFASLFRVVNQVKPDECYHLAALSYVSYSFEDEFSQRRPLRIGHDKGNRAVVPHLFRRIQRDVRQGPRDPSK